MRGETFAVALLIQRGDEQQGLLCAHSPQEAVLNGVNGGLRVPGVVDRVVEVHGEEFERSLQKRNGPEIGKGGAFVRVFLQRVDPTSLPTLGDHPMFERKVDHAPDDLLEGRAAEGDQRVAEAGRARCRCQGGLQQEITEPLF